MATYPTPPQPQPPPDVPAIPGLNDQLAQYLRTFALWCRNGFAAKMDTQTAQQGFLMQAYDAAPGTTPAVWMIRVNSAGVVSTVQAPLGTGKP